MTGRALLTVIPFFAVALGESPPPQSPGVEGFCPRFQSSLYKTPSADSQVSVADIPQDGICYTQYHGLPQLCSCPKLLPIDPETEEEVDWRNCWGTRFPPVQQWWGTWDHRCYTSACWAIAAATAIDGFRCKEMSPLGAGKAGILPKPLENVTSIQEICSCAGDRGRQTGDLCSSGSYYEASDVAFSYAAKSLKGVNGYAPELADKTVFDGNMNKKECNWQKLGRVGLAAVTKCNYVRTWYPLVLPQDVYRSERVLARAVMQQPIAVAATLYGGTWFETFQGNRIVDADYIRDKNGKDGCGCMKGGPSPANQPLAHAVTVVGYGRLPALKKYWIIRNSYGTAWGAEGYLYLERESPEVEPSKPHGLCCIAEYPSYPVLFGQADQTQVEAGHAGQAGSQPEIVP